MNTSAIKRILLPVLLALCALFIQGSILRYMLPEFAVPNLLLAMVVFIGFYEISPFGALIVFILGIEADLCSGVLIGPSAGAFTFIFGAITALSTRLFVESSFAVAITTFISSLIANSVYLALVSQFAPSVGRSFGIVFGEALTTAILAPILFAIFRRVLIPRREQRSPRLGGSRSRQRLASS